MWLAHTFPHISAALKSGCDIGTICHASAHRARSSNNLFGQMIVTTGFCQQGKTHLFKRSQSGDAFCFCPTPTSELTGVAGLN